MLTLTDNPEFIHHRYLDLTNPSSGNRISSDTYVTSPYFQINMIGVSPTVEYGDIDDIVIVSIAND